MVSKLVLGYPEFNERDYDWIQDIRKKYDERYFEVVGPHFTIVFPVFDFETEKFISHIKQKTEGFCEIKFEIKASTIVKDVFSDYTDVFLVPDKGNSGIIKLHDKLYEGVLKNELRLDIPFIPHIAIAASTNAEEAKEISDKINSESFEIISSIKSLDIVEFDYPKVQTIKKITLQ